MKNDLPQLFQQTVEGSRNIVVILDNFHRITWTNASFTKSLLYTPEEVFGHPVHFLYAQGYHFQVDTQNDHEVRWVDKEGNVIWVHVNQFNSMVHNHTYTVIIANPITKWKNLEEVSKEQEILIDGFSNSFSEINIVVGYNFQVMAFNNFAERFFRRYLNINLNKGQNLISVLPEWMKPYMGQQIYRAFDNEKITRKRYIRYFRKFFNLGFFPISQSNNQVMAVSFHAEDITKQEQYLMRLRKQKNQIRKIAWENSHAIRRPVANIVGLTDWLHTNQEFNGEKGYMIRKILESSIDLDRKIKHLSKQLETFK